MSEEAPVSLFDRFTAHLPVVEAPIAKKLDFATKLKWTLIVLVSYFVLKHVPLFGLGASALAQFQSLSVLLGADFGSLLSLGIGPIVTGSIILQLLNGSGMLKFDLTTHAGKARFQGMNKVFSYFFLIFESFIFVFMGGLTPDPLLKGTSLFVGLELALVAQLILGGFLIILLDDLVSKWGIGSGISLFIAAGVSESLFIQLFSPFTTTGSDYMVGAIPSMFQALARADGSTLALSIAGVLATVFVFMLVVYFQSMKAEIPLSFGRVRGMGIRWPLNFLYTSNTPVILVAALLANVRLGAYFIQNRFGADSAVNLANWFSPPHLLRSLITGGSFIIGWEPYLQALFYLAIMMIGSLIFSWFWMQTSGMDAKSQAKTIMGSGLQIPGFRNDPRIIEHILSRYIGPLTIMGGLTVGFLSAIADISGAVVSGTGLLLSVMIVYKFYEDIARQHMVDMNPAMRKFMGR